MKVTSLTLALVLALPACGKKKEADPAAPAEPAAKAAAEPAPAPAGGKTFTGKVERFQASLTLPASTVPEDDGWVLRDGPFKYSFSLEDGGSASASAEALKANVMPSDPLALETVGKSFVLVDRAGADGNKRIEVYHELVLGEYASVRCLGEAHNSDEEKPADPDMKDWKKHADVLRAGCASLQAKLVD